MRDWFLLSTQILITLTNHSKSSFSSFFAVPLSCLPTTNYKKFDETALRCTFQIFAMLSNGKAMLRKAQRNCDMMGHFMESFKYRKHGSRSFLLASRRNEGQSKRPTDRTEEVETEMGNQWSSTVATWRNLMLCDYIYQMLLFLQTVIKRKCWP